MFFGLLLLFNYSFICFSCRFLFDFFLIFFSSLFFVSSCFLVSFTFLSLFKLHFVGLFIISVFPHVKLCAKKEKCIFLNFCKTLFFCLLFSIKISVFSVSFFCCAFFRPIYFSMFCFSVSWKNGFSFLCNSPFLILRFKSVSLCLLSFFFWCIQEKNVFGWKWWKNSLLYSVSDLLFFFWKDIVCAQKSVVFSIIFETVWILFSLHFKAQKNRQKNLHFLFLFSPFLFHFFSFNIFPIFFFHHCCLCSLFPFIFLFISTCSSLLYLFSLFSLPSFLLYLSVSLSHPLYLMFPYFFHRRFCVSFFGLTHFFFSLLILISLFSYFFFTFLFVSSSPSLFFLQKNQKFLWSIFTDEIVLFLNPPFFGVWSLVFPSLRRPLSLICSMFLLILSVSWHYCSWFSFINLLFGSLRKIVVLFWTKIFKKISLILFKNWFFVEQTLVFLILTNFCYKLVFFSFLLFFQCLKKKILCLLS